ncbi:MAG TPA: histidine phosphatase family protein [Polyangiaceae bacterium]|nr:histidine phosphatase family protein [Polyangiaceae bacterium]
MLTIHLVRHGDTIQAADGIFSGELDPPLTAHGVEQAELLGKASASMDLVALYCSPKLRARQTAEPVARASGLTPDIQDGLHEILYGSWEGRKETEVHAADTAAFEAWRSDPSFYSPPGGETAFTIAARALPVVRLVRERHATGHVMLVSHKATVRVITCALLGIPLQRFRTHIACPTTSITSFEFHDEGPLLIGLGDTHHLH